ncbi:MAG TPA: glutamate formimidoyltransferase [Caldithrix abyssi]|uniref:Formimidoyltransferase-cyclodeaminase n=1 Tax=Caldithrix abyssi TaxID=187145 RepID=A0A7V5RNP4_CALAY|nr:glutamate formimidoyltransferase [Caldithrix abyssi]
MAEKIIECVPNFSEGRDAGKIKQITDVIESVEGIRLLDVDPGAEMNRTVVTFIGNPGAVKEAAFQAIKKAADLIDMRHHSGSHPRMGATDVCPFIPVNGVTVEECIALSKEVAQRVGDELGIPVYLYEKSAQKPERENLAVIRAGEYEALEEKLKQDEWKPDFGPAKFNPRAGATVMGVREFLIAYNISLNSREKLHATDIAFELREKGRSARKGADQPYYYKKRTILKYKEGSYPCGNCDFIGKTMTETVNHCREKHDYDLPALLRLNGIDPQTPEGKSVKKPGLFKNCKAIGWFVPEFDRVQISINLTNYKVTSMHHVLDATRKLAAERGLVVTGSEIVGLVPFDALLESGFHYLKMQGRSRGIPYRDVLNTAVQSLVLSDVSDFNIDERVLGLPRVKEGDLIHLRLHEFVDEVSRESPAPGGGSVAALAGAIGAALSSMVSNLTANRRGSEEVDGVLNETAEVCQEIQQKLTRGIDEDTNAFNAYMEARRMPATTAGEREAREAAMLEGLKSAVNVPMETARQSFRAIKVAATVAKYGNPASITDVGVGAQMAFAGVKGGIYNVLINLKDISDADFVGEMRRRCEALEKEARESLDEVLKIVESKLS